MTETKAVQDSGVSSWFMSNPFQKNAVYTLLTGADYDFVVGMDVGHGETVAYLFILEKNGDGMTVRVERLRLNHEDDAKLPTLLRFTDDKAIIKAIIGRKARNAPGFFQHFKVAPSRWDTKIDQVHTHGELMEAFIRTLWEQILQYQPKLAESTAQGRVLLTVGCPSSREWTSPQAMERYRALLERATGCTHTTVLPESTAAIMAAVLSAEETVPPYKLQLEKGIAVLDAGSSTLDFTYVQLGQTLITRSLALGGHDLDEQMLEVAMEDSGLVRSQIPGEQRPTLLMQLREMKEAFYPGGDSLGIQIIPIWGLDGEGRADPDLPSDLQLKFTVNRAFMERALNRPGIQLNGHLSPRQSWLELYREFVQYTRALCPDCDKVIITGGTSFVTQVREAVNVCYGDQVIQSRDPSSSVARGLGYAKSLESRGRVYLGDYKAFAKKLSEQQYKAFTFELATYIAGVVCDNMQVCAASLAESDATVVVGSFIERVNQRVLRSPKLTGETGEQAVQEIFSRHFSEAVVKIHEEANKISAHIYGASIQSAPRFSSLTADQLAAISKRLGLSSVVSKAWIATLVPGAIFSILSTVLLVMAMALAVIQPLTSLLLITLSLALDNQNCQEKIMEFVVKDHTEMKPWMLRKVVGSLEKESSRQKTVIKAAGKAAEAMQKAGVLKQELESILQDQAEIALGKVLFLVYDNEPS